MRSGAGGAARRPDLRRVATRARATVEGRFLDIGSTRRALLGLDVVVGLQGRRGQARPRRIRTRKDDHVVVFSHRWKDPSGCGGVTVEWLADVNLSSPHVLADGMYATFDRYDPPLSEPPATLLSRT